MSAGEFPVGCRVECAGLGFAAGTVLDGRGNDGGVLVRWDHSVDHPLWEDAESLIRIDSPDEPETAEGDGLREKVAQVLMRHDHVTLAKYIEGSAYARMADAVLAIPKITAALARPALPEGMTSELVEDLIGHVHLHARELDFTRRKMTTDERALWDALLARWQQRMDSPALDSAAPAPESSTDPGEGEWPPLMRAEDVNRMYQDGGAWQVGVALDSPDEGFHWLPLNEVACSREDEPFLPEWPNLLVVAAPWKGRAAMPTPRPGEGEATADGEHEHATASMTGAERYLADRMADPEYAAAYAAALPEVPDGYEIVVLPTEVVDEWAHRGPVLTDRDIATVGACQAAVDRRPKPAPETERVRAMEAVEDRRKVVHPTGPFEAEAIMWIEGEMAVCEYGGPAAPIDSDGTVEVLVDGES